MSDSDNDLSSSNIRETSRLVQRKEISRLVFTVYWQDAFPSTEIIYTQHHRDSIKRMEQEVLYLLKANCTNSVLDVIYVIESPLMMTEEEISDVGWRFI